MKFTELLGERRAPSEEDPEIAGLSADSRAVAPGFLFAALPGTRLDGRRFAREAVTRGAVAILTDDAAALALTDDEQRRVTIALDPNPWRRLALCAARFHGRQPRTIAAVTGTNGKTSVVHFTREIWTALGLPAASLGTLGVVTDTVSRPGTLTTPDPVALHRELAAFAAGGIEHVALEASSHGLQQFRLDGVAVAAAAFTNLTRDHLDYHGDMERYRAAKERLFRDLLIADGPAVLNADSDEFPRLAALCRDLSHPVLAYGAAPQAELRLVECAPHAAGQHLVLDILGQRHRLLLPLAGAFQAMNALCALGLVIAIGAPPAAATATLATLSGVPGRLQLVATGPAGGAIFVDYAHTPDALATVLKALRVHAQRRLAIVFGCGGDRDPGKRPLMGRVAAELADCAIVTDDNPRGEPPGAIRRAILAAAPGMVEIGDRRAAIAAAITGLGPGDLLLIAGKGHEIGQIVGNAIYPFDDAEIARETARTRGWQVIAAERAGFP